VRVAVEYIMPIKVDAITAQKRRDLFIYIPRNRIRIYVRRSKMEDVNMATTSCSMEVEEEEDVTTRGGFTIVVDDFAV
jgi:Fe-S cluster assembly iron-binding protein IscA